MRTILHRTHWIGTSKPDFCHQAYASTGARLVRYAQGALAPVLGAREGRIVLLRPDRYVAGAFAADEAPAFAKALERLVDRGTAGM